MKLLFFLLLAPSLAFSQLEIKEKEEPKVIGEVNIGIGGSGYVMSMIHREEVGYYRLMFRNIRYSSIVDIKGFNFNDEDFETLYTAINEGLTKREKKELEVELDNGDILTLQFKGRTVAFALWNDTSLSVSSQINKRQLDKLFGKTN